jgi:predicted nucleic acid-binding protein
VCLKKWSIDRKTIENAIDEICRACIITEIKVETIKTGMFLQEKYKYSYFDSLMLAAALESGCGRIFSEDMHNGQIIENTLEIINIFK